MPKKERIYFAAGLFNMEHTSLNVQLAELLEKLGYQVDVPQRDGFEFARLNTALEKVLDKEKVSTAVENCIFALDIGWFLSRADATLARFDEPLDPGVDIEVTISHSLGTYTLGYRTDVRTPYGPADSNFRGMHFFPATMCDEFILAYPDYPKETLVSKFHERIQNKDNKLHHRWRSGSRKVIVEIQEYAQILFEGIPDLHSDEGLKTIAERYVANQERLKLEILPRIIRLY